MIESLPFPMIGILEVLDAQSYAMSASESGSYRHRSRYPKIRVRNYNDLDSQLRCTLRSREIDSKLPDWS